MMRRIAFWLALGAASLAKPSLPVEIKNAGNHVTVVFQKPAQQIQVEVKGTGSVSMAAVSREASSLNAGQEIQVPVRYQVSDRNGLGGLAVHVSADFGAGRESQWRTFDLVLPAAPVRARTQSGNSSQDVILVPSQTKIPR
ncbi:MAG: hypothetical protein J0I12_14220 [Candidatus Eremiobacteraeota bacterium]|nr:hypothetical protein [Candidatus Eremiobacteraeota bacterium]